MVQNRLKKILCLILFLSLSPLVFATDLNWSLTGTESENLISNNTTEGVIASINDDSATTYRGVGSAAGGGGEIILEFEHEIAFTETVNTINKIEVVSEAGGISGGILEFKVYLYYSAGWNLVYTGGTESWSKQTDDQTGTWSSVSKIKLYVKGNADNAPDRPRTVGLKDYELRAWGPPNYSDIGLRVYDGSSVIKIGVQDLDGHALRVRDGDTTYGIPLLATDSADASSLRIFDGSNVKALPAVD